MADNDRVVPSGSTEGVPGLELTRPGDTVHRIGPYELVEELGRGGMGVVYKARRLEDGAVVAIKLLSSHAIDDEKLRQRFLREARAAASITHPNIARVHGIFEEGPLLAIVMDYIPGTTLRNWLKRRHGRDGDRPGARDIAWVIRIAQQVGRGLAAAHEAGIVHRDIKPSNILLDPTGEHAWIADFGLAAFELGDDSLTSTGRQLGTPAYMSPEQARGERVDRRSDLFSFGCLIYAMVTGESPFHANNLMAVMRKISEVTPVSLLDHDPRCPRALARVVERLLEKDPGERYDRVDDVITALDRCAEDPSCGLPWPTDLDPTATEEDTVAPVEVTERGEDAAEDSSGLPTTLTAGVTEPFPRVSMQSLPMRGKAARRAAFIGVGVLVAVLGTAWFFLGPRSEPAPGPRVAAPPKPATTAPAGRRRTVSAEHAADYSSLRDALGAAQANDTIEVLDASTYDGPFVIDDPYRLEGVRLISKAGAGLRAEGNHGRMAVLTVDGVRRVRVEGFRIIGASYLHSVFVRGNVTGTTLSGLHITQPADAQWANVLLSRECRGTADEPIQIHECRFESGKFGLFSGRDDIAEALELSHLVVDGNHFSGSGTHVVLLHSASEVRIEHNTFEGGRGIELNLGSPRPSGAISVVNNTFHGTEVWLLFGPDRGDYGGVAVNNLIVDTMGRSWNDPFGPRRASWRVDHNIWESAGSDADRNLDGFGRATADAGLRSRDPASPDFVRPLAGGAAATGGVGPPLPAYVGARRP